MRPMCAMVEQDFDVLLVLSFEQISSAPATMTESRVSEKSKCNISLIVATEILITREHNRTKGCSVERSGRGTFSHERQTRNRLSFQNRIIQGSKCRIYGFDHCIVRQIVFTLCTQSNNISVQLTVHVHVQRNVQLTSSRDAHCSFVFSPV